MDHKKCYKKYQKMKYLYCIIIVAVLIALVCNKEAIIQYPREIIIIITSALFGYLIGKYIKSRTN